MGHISWDLAKGQRQLMANLDMSTLMSSFYGGLSWFKERGSTMHVAGMVHNTHTWELSSCLQCHSTYLH